RHDVARGSTHATRSCRSRRARDRSAEPRRDHPARTADPRTPGHPDDLVRRRGRPCERPPRTRTHAWSTRMLVSGRMRSSPLVLLVALGIGCNRGSHAEEATGETSTSTTEGGTTTEGAATTYGGPEACGGS